MQAYNVTGHSSDGHSVVSMITPNLVLVQQNLANEYPFVPVRITFMQNEYQDCANTVYEQHLPVLTWIFSIATLLMLFVILFYFVMSKLQSSFKFLSITVLLAHSGDEAVEMYNFLILAKGLSHSLYYFVVSMALVSIDGVLNFLFAVPIGTFCDMYPKRTILFCTFARLHCA